MKSKYLIILLLSLQLSSEAFTLTPIGIKLVNKLHRGEIQRVTSIKMVEENKKKSTSISWSKNEGLQFFDIPATPEIWMIAIVYFIQGLLGISRLALSFYYKDTLHLSPVDLTLISSITAIPWIIKPFYGFISDTFPLFGYKRKSYLALSGILGSISWCLMALLAKSLQCGILQGNTATIATSIFLASLSSLSIAFSDVLVDAIVVGKSRDQSQAGSLQSLCWSSTAIGGIISAYLSGYLFQNYGAPFVFTLTALMPLAMGATSMLLDETKIKIAYQAQSEVEKPGTLTLLKLQVHNIAKVLSEKTLLYPLLFIIIWNITPSAGSALFYFEVNELGFKPEFLGVLGLASSLSSLAGIVIYNQKLKFIPLQTVFKWCCIVGTIIGMSPLILITHVNRSIGLPDAWFAIIDDVILSILGQITFMPVLVLAANICPPGVEAMLYATIMGCINLSGSLGKIFGGLLTKYMGITNNNFKNLHWLVILTNLSGLIPLMFLGLLPNNKNKNETDAEK
jgi:folate/biopterin transporter